jgi:acetyl esterase
VPEKPQFDERVQRMLRASAASLASPFRVDDLPMIRERFDAMSGDRVTVSGVAIYDIEIEQVPVRIYRPRIDGLLPLHLYMHGGGFVLGSARSGAFDGALSRRAASARCLVASVDYRLAPEHRFPAGLEDCYVALAGLVADASDLSIALPAISVGGASSGGNFAAALALMARDRGGSPIIFQLLEIAGTDLTKSSHAWRTFQPGHDTTRARDLQLVDLYLPDLATRAHPYASPLFAPDLSGLPPAYVMNAEFDPRRDECEAYVARLNDAGVQAIGRTLAGHIHGSMSLPDWPPAQAWQAEANEVLAKAHTSALESSATTHRS